MGARTAVPRLRFRRQRCRRLGRSADTGLSVAAWQDVLRGSDVRVRPDSSTWSPLEYGCHVRDVCHRFEARLRLMLTREDPDFENWDQDTAAIAGRYGEQDPPEVARQLHDRARSFAALLESVTGERWRRTGRRSDGAQFTVDSFARYFIHDVVHHLHDVSEKPAA